MHDLESIVFERLRSFLNDGPAVVAAAGDASHQARAAQHILATASTKAAALASSSQSERQALLQRLIQLIARHEDSIDIVVRTRAIWDQTDPDPSITPTTLTAPIARVRRGTRATA